MDKLANVFRSFFAAPVRPTPHKRQLSREEIMSLVVNKKLTRAQAKAVLAKRFHG